MVPGELEKTIEMFMGKPVRDYDSAILMRKSMLRAVIVTKL